MRLMTGKSVYKLEKMYGNEPLNRWTDPLDRGFLKSGSRRDRRKVIKFNSLFTRMRKVCYPDGFLWNLGSKDRAPFKLQNINLDYLGLKG